MAIRERFMVGIYLAASSFWLLWLYKKLLVYLSCAALIFFCIQVFLYNLPMFGFAGDEISLFIALQGLQCQITVSGWLYQIALVIGSFLYVFMLTVFHWGLIRHTLAIVHGNVSLRVIQVLKETLHYWRTIMYWSLLFTMIHVFVSLVSSIFSLCPHAWSQVGTILTYLLLIIWSVLTFLVLPVLVAENQGVWGAIRRSLQLVSKILVEMVGAQCWIVTICLLAVMPLAMLMGAFSSPTNLNVVFVLVTWLVIFASYIVLSAQTVIKTLLYQRSINVS